MSAEQLRCMADSAKAEKFKKQKEHWDLLMANVHYQLWNAAVCREKSCWDLTTTIPWGTHIELQRNFTATTHQISLADRIAVIDQLRTEGYTITGPLCKPGLALPNDIYTIEWPKQSEKPLGWEGYN